MSLTGCSREYYDLRGWNEAGEPTEDTLGRLGLILDVNANQSSGDLGISSIFARSTPSNCLAVPALTMRLGYWVSHLIRSDWCLLMAWRCPRLKEPGLCLLTVVRWW